MGDDWEVVIEPFVFEDLLSTDLHPFDVVTVSERILALCRYLTATQGNPGDGFVVWAIQPPMLGVVRDRLLALFRHERIRYRTWRNLWLRPRERCLISVRLLRLVS